MRNTFLMKRRTVRWGVGVKLVGALFVSLHFTACATTTAAGAAGAAQVRYFATFSGPRESTQPINEITQEQAQKWRAYYVASYDRGGRAITVEKMLNGERFLLWEYSYHANGKIASARISNQAGKTTILNYDQNGNATGAVR